MREHLEPTITFRRRAKAVDFFNRRFLSWTAKLQPAFLLAVRLYWGWGFFVAGKGKLLNLKATTQTFEMWEIPFPSINAAAAGAAETVFGLALFFGFASRLSSIPLIFVMAVAYGTAHRDAFESLNAFVGAPPFTYLEACLIVLLFGPGRFSLDHYVKPRLLGGGRPDGAS